MKNKIEFYSDDFKAMSSKEYSEFMIKIMSIKSIQKTQTTGEKMTSQKDDKSITTNPMTMKYQSFKQFFTESEPQKATAISTVEPKESE